MYRHVHVADSQRADVRRGSLAIVFHTCAPAGLGVTHAVLGLIVGLAVFFPLFALGAMGAGDVKLMAAIGAWLGWKSVIRRPVRSLAGGVLALYSRCERISAQALSNIKMLASTGGSRRQATAGADARIEPQRADAVCVGDCGGTGGDVMAN